MNRKLLNGLLLVAASCAAVGTFTSCKDNTDEIIAQIHEGDEALDARIKSLETTVNDLNDKIEACKTECATKFTDLLRRMGVAEDKIAVMEPKITDALNRITALEGKVVTSQNIKDMIAEVFSEMTDEDFERLGLVTDDELDTRLQELADMMCTCGDLKDRVTALENLIDGINSRFDGIDGRLDGIDGRLDALEAETGLTEADVQGLIDASLTGIKDDIDALKRLVPADLAAQLQQISDNATKIQALEDDMVNALSAYNYIETNKNKLTILLGLADGLQDKLDQIDTNTAGIAENKENIENLQASLDTLIDTTIPNMQSEIIDLSDRIETVNDELIEKLNNLGDELGDRISKLDKTVTANYNELKGLIEANETAITNLQIQLGNFYKELNDRFNRLITGIINQQTYNHLYGNFALPIGVQSNLLFNFYGVNDNSGFTFPSSQSIATYDKGKQLTEKDLEMLALSGNFKPAEIGSGAVLVNEFANKPGYFSLGRLYVTINPNNINFAGQHIELVNSRDEGTPIELNLERSNDLLTFGYTRAEANNGFYKAEAVMPATREAINQINPKIDASLKSAAKELLHDISRSSIFGLMKGVYDQMSGLLPAYGLKAAWKTEDDKEYATYSKYDIAATAVRPLSYITLKGESVPDRYHFPIIDPISESFLDLNPEDYTFDFSNIKVNINANNVELGFEFKPIEIDYKGELTVKTTLYDMDGNEIGTSEGKVDPADLEAFIEEIQASFNDQIGTWNTEIENKFKKAIEDLMDDVNKEVKRVIDQMAGEINGQLKDMIGDLQDEVNGKFGDYIGKFNNLLTKYNRVAEKLNNVLDDPNHYLQPTILYNSGDGNVHFLSNNINRPTKFKRAGGDCVTLYPTTYTAEVLTPAYKKFIGCTNVIDGNKSAANGDAELQAELKKINSLGMMNQAYNGVARRFALPVPASLKAGVTYELVYTAVDYHGNTQTVKYYFTVE